jgi:ubiquitin-protein ligase
MAAVAIKPSQLGQHELPPKRVKMMKNLLTLSKTTTILDQPCKKINNGSATVTVSLSGPLSSPYEGANFDVSLTTTATTVSVVWQTAIYHPCLSAGSQLCRCLLPDSVNPATLKAACMAILAAVNLFKPCSHCRLNTAVWCELHANPSLFRCKAKAHTPGTLPLTDAELQPCLQTSMHQAGLDLSHLLRSGQFSDVKVAFKLFS